MPYINLIAEQRAALRAVTRKSRAWFLAFASVAGVFALTVGFFFMRSGSLNAEIADLKAQAEQLQPLKDGIERNQSALAQMKPRMETLQTARLDTERWTRILDHMSLVMPQNSWLTNVAAVQSNDTKPVEITWIGMSSEQSLVGELMLRMQQSPDFSDVQLKFTETKHTQYGVGIEFNITSSVAGTESKISTAAQKQGANS
jgi:Tfp pilus assembly protein PilN